MENSYNVGLDIGDFAIVASAEDSLLVGDSMPRRATHTDKPFFREESPLLRVCIESPPSPRPYHVGRLGRVIDAELDRIDKLSGTTYKIKKLDLLITQNDSFAKIFLYPKFDISDRKLFFGDKWVKIDSVEDIEKFFDVLDTSVDVHHSLKFGNYLELKEIALRDYALLKEADLNGNYTKMIRLVH